MVEENIRVCKQAGLEGQVSYKIQTGKPAEEIIKVSEEMNVDLLVMVSSTNTSLVREVRSGGLLIMLKILSLLYTDN